MKYLEDFLDYILYEKRYSLHTVQGYRCDLEQFLFFISNTYSISEIPEVNRSIIRSWIVHLMQSGLSPTSVRRKSSSLQSFFKYLNKKKVLDYNPARNIILPKKKSSIPIFVQEKDMKKMIEESFQTDAKDYATQLKTMIINLLYQTGMRRAEMIGLKMSDIHTNRREISVLGKGNKERLIPVTNVMIDQINTYTAARNNLGQIIDREYFLLTPAGKKLYPNFIYRTVTSTLNEWAKLSKSSPHVLRHTFATHLSANGADLNAIKSLLGHSSLASTQIYTHHSMEGLRKAYQSAHPKGKENN